jgi:hypothetical protein
MEQLLELVIKESERSKDAALITVSISEQLSTTPRNIMMTKRNACLLDAASRKRNVQVN